MTIVKKAVEAVEEFRRRHDTLFDEAWQLKPGYTTEVAERFYSEFGQTAARLLPELIDAITGAESEHGLRCNRCHATTVRLTVRDWGVCLGCGAGGQTGEFSRCDAFCEDCEDAAVTDEAELRRLEDELNAKRAVYRGMLIPIEDVTPTKLSPFIGRWIEVQGPGGSVYGFGTLTSVSRTGAIVDGAYYALKEHRFICHPAANHLNSGPCGQRIIPVLMAAA